MTSEAEVLDLRIKSKLAALSTVERDYWSFRGRSAREGVHTYFQYPAMMVPQVQGSLIKAILSVQPAINNVYDPFAGSGTILTEAMALGLNFLGQDINPMAVLLCLTKSGPLYEQSASEKTEHLLSAMHADRKSCIEVSFPNRDKWFEKDVAIALSRIQRAIRTEPTLWCRRFFWVALAETVRLTSNSRTSTFKLHVRPSAEISRRQTSPENIFEQTVKKNIASLGMFKRELDEAGLLRQGRYVGNTRIRLADSANDESGDEQAEAYDLLVTSPPYGDNTSTVPYGQHAYLPLQWIDFKDIDERLNIDCLSTTHQIDSLSLGGSRKITQRHIELLCELSPSFREVVAQLTQQPSDRLGRVTAFYRDLNRSLGVILANLKPNSYMVWTVGNRCVGGMQIPTDKILTELLIAQKSVFVTQIERSILSKRMALKNALATTMNRESILILRKGI
jgi:hypothetical protein